MTKAERLARAAVLDAAMGYGDAQWVGGRLNVSGSKAQRAYQASIISRHSAEVLHALRAYRAAVRRAAQEGT